LAEAPLLLAVLFVGTDFVAVKYALEGFPPLALAALRFTVAGLLLCCLALLIEPASRPEKADLPPMLGLGLVGVSLNQGSYIGGLSLTSGSNAALVFATAPVWGLLLGVVLRLERARLYGALGVLLALIGVGFVVGEGLDSSAASLPGDLLVLVSAVSWGGYAVLSLPLLRRYPPLSVAAYPMLLGGLVLMTLASVQGSLASVDWGTVGARAWAGAAYSTLLSSAFAFAAWQLGVSRLGANRTLAYLYLVTLVGVASSVLVLGDDLGVAKVLGGCAILAGVYLARRRRRASGRKRPRAGR
jgi:drug/metabolite transporter (DMT)-like permease